MSVLEKYFLENNIITNKQAEAIGIKRHTLALLARKGEIERIKNGVYKKKDTLYDDFSLISLNTALYLLGFSDRIPNIFHISVPQGYNVEHIKRKCSNIKVHYIKREFFHLGACEIKTPHGVQVKCYNIERCICDIVAERKSVDKQIFTDAMTRYFKSRDKNIRNLIKYSRVFGIEDEIRKYMEVL